MIRVVTGVPVPQPRQPFRNTAPHPYRPGADGATCAGCGRTEQDGNHITRSAR